jgi:hypothetical protein
MESPGIIQIITETLPPSYQGIIDKFRKCIEIEVKLPLDEQLLYLLDGYIKNCGVSFGYRSVFLDFADIILQEVNIVDEYQSVEDYASIHIQDWNEYKDYDAGMPLEQTIATAIMLFHEGVSKECVVVFCYAFNKFILKYEKSIEKDLLIKALKFI